MNRSKASRVARIRLNHGHLDYGYRSVRAEISVHVLRARSLDSFSWRRSDARNADRYFPRNQDPGGVGDLELYRPQHARDGAARHHLQSVLDQRERQRNQEYRSAEHEWAVGPEDLFPARRQSRSCHRADRGRHQCNPRAHAPRHPAAGRCAVQCVQRAGPADQPELRYPQRAGALRLRHLSDASAARPDRGHHAADSRRRQVPPDHGRYRSREARGQGSDPTGCRQRGECAESDAAVGHGEDR